MPKAVKFETVDLSIKLKGVPKPAIDFVIKSYKKYLRISEGVEVEMKYQSEFDFEEAIDLSDEETVNSLMASMLAFQCAKSERNIN